jgi:hypothetical protein
MRIGIATIYSWRPHVECMAIVADCLKTKDVEIYSLVCKSDLKICHNIAAKPSVPRIVNCMACRGKGLNAYFSNNVQSIGDFHGKIKDEYEVNYAEWGHSSAATLGRFESKKHFESIEFKNLKYQFSEIAFTSFKAAVEWIKGNKLNRILVFNGRIDATRGIIEAAKYCKIPYVTIERGPFGFGLQILVEESCLGLKNLLVKYQWWKNIPLNESECERIGSLIASRILRQSKSEWRIYNVNAVFQDWPTKKEGPKVLILPSSTNEINDAVDWSCGWEDSTDPFDALIDHFNLNPSEVVIRCHPNWSEKVYGASGEKIEAVFQEWAQSRGIHLISSSDRASTVSLIKQSDIIIVNGGSSALEAAFMGKRVIATRPSNNYTSSFVIEAHSKRQLKNISKRIDDVICRDESERMEIVRSAVRYFSYFVFKFPILTKSIITPDVTSALSNISKTDVEELVCAVEGLEKDKDIKSNSDDISHENQLIKCLLDFKFSDLVKSNEVPPNFKGRPPRGFYWLFRKIRDKFNRGDRM